ncbi:MAG: DNA starvation/stationary phase protection protein Dps [Limnothrix sp.]
MAKSKVTLYPSRIDLSKKTRSSAVVLLNQTLATTIDLQSQAKQAHWNVKGLDFYQLHELFDELSGELIEYIDMIAERVTALGSIAFGTVKTAAKESILASYPPDAVTGTDHLTALADCYGKYAAHLREGIEKAESYGDSDTEDLYTEISRTIDKRLWFLEAHLHPSTPEK